ncbi:hypothetical protein N7539_005391 [Penicillium diatomitis]|uniref:Uncharacterized protein n=1 Tax=Penicillium diatomitis TaxID=2819901 RepID=A0A9W9X6I9_9EURO|nr:uncharacterized protein N7539_005391 [Penicillium diatomitis]KAJ5485403.1 hypothetical protein N7539_005391 [Penicillium diatomitis]
MQAPRTTSDILSLFRERGLPIKRSLIDEVDAALCYSAAAAETQEWVSTHLTPSTLLSREEVTLYDKLESSGALQQIIHNPDLGATRPFLEDEIRLAIASLEATTAEIEKQTETLSFQHEILQKQLRQSEESDQARDRDLARLKKKHEAERQRVVISADDLAQELENEFRIMTERTAIENKRILALLSSRLKQDDKTLADLEDFILGIRSDGNDAESLKRTGQLSELLAKYSAEQIHYRLDRLYLEGIMAEESSPTTVGGDVAALEEELAALYPEIEILAEMSTKHEFRDPILRAIQHEHSRLRTASVQQLEQALDVLIDMTRSQECLTEQLHERESSCELLQQLANLYHTVVGQTLTTPAPSARRDSLRRRSIPAGVLTAPRSSETSSLIALKDPALENLLRRVGLSPESIARSHAEHGEAWAQDLHEKRVELNDTLQALSMAGDAPLITGLGSADKAYHLLFSALHRESKYAISLRDSSQEKALSDLDSELGQLQKAVKMLDLNVLHQRDQRRDRFMDKWGP